LKGQVALSVTSPSDIGGSSVTGYDYSVDNGSTWSHFASVDGPFRISGLINGTTYQVRIRAVNVAGAGVASDAVSVTPTNLVPSIPTINSTVAGNQSADVVIATATGVTAASITGYQYNINGGLSWSTCAMTDNRCVVSGLINGVRTTIKVRAVNPNGVGLASAKAYVTPVTTAQAPTITSLIPSVGALTIAFSAPSDNGGSKVLRYEYSLDGETWIAPTKAIVKSPYKIVGLANASAYTVQIRAINAVGVGEASSAEIVSTPVALASAPVVTSLVAAKNSITVNFSTPVSDGGGIITNFAYMIDGKNWVSVNPASASSPIVIGGLLSNKSYTVKLRAINSAGSGAISAAQSVKTLK
jgi:titin